MSRHRPFPSKLARRLAALAMIAIGLSASSSLAQLREDVVTFEIPVLPESQQYLQFLTVPGYAALMLESNGLYPSVSSRVVVKNRDRFEMQTGSLRYKSKQGTLYVYEGGFKVPLGIGEAAVTVTFPVEIQTNQVAKGTLLLHVHTPLARFLPEEFLERIQFKIRSIADPGSQVKLLRYLDRLSKEQEAAGRGFEGTLEAIALDAYNRSTRAESFSSDRRVDSLSSQVLLLMVVGIWLLGFPIFILVARRTKKAP